MALFKILKGEETNLPAEYHEGWAYITTDEGNFYVDVSDTERKKIASKVDEAIKATNDSSNQKIVDHYIKDITLVTSASAPYYTITLGNGLLRDSDGDGEPDKLIIPVASSSKAGVITTGTQTIKGTKTFSSQIKATGGITTSKQFTSTLANGTAPFAVTSTTVNTNLNADMVDGFHASNDIFTPNGTDADKYLPTRAAIWGSFNDLLIGAKALVYRGVLDLSSASNIPSDPESGDTYIISKGGTLDGQVCEVGDLAIAYFPSGATTASWDILQSNIDGAVSISGGASTTKKVEDNAIARFDGTTGQIIHNSDIIINDSGHMLPNGTGDDGQDIGSSDKKWSTIYAASFDGLATNATQDASNQTITTTYLTNITLVNSKNAPYYSFTDGAATEKGTANLPIADASNADESKWTAGIITSDDQTLTGTKTFNNKGAIVITKAAGFNYSGISSDSDSTENAARSIWISKNGTAGTPILKSNFTFNPACVEKWNTYDGDTVSSYGVLNVDRVNGLALKALKDAKNNTIADTYINSLSFNSDKKSIPQLIATYPGTTEDLVLDLPAASKDNGGIITTGAQTITGAKTINDTGSLTISGSDKFIYSGLKADDTLTTDQYLWFSATGGIPTRSSYLTYCPKKADASTGTWKDYKTSGNYAVLKTDRFEGLSLQALKDHKNNLISSYIKNIVFKTDVDGHTSTSCLVFTTGGSSETIVDLPAASASNGGVVTTGYQVITGEKQIDSNGSLEVIASEGFNYSGIQEGVGDLKLWGSADGVPKSISDIMYDTNTDTLTVPKITSIVSQATADGKNQNIASTYIKNISIANTVDLVLTYGDGTTSTLANKLNVVGSTNSTSKLYLIGATSQAASVSTYSNSAVYIQSGNLYATKVYNAVWNDYAECRKAETIEAGRVVIEDNSGEMKLSTERLQPGANIVSDTFGICMGETEDCKTPIAVAGRVLAYPYEDRNSYPLGAAVCTGPNGTVSLMTREEIREYPERIIGTVSEIPNYTHWGSGNVPVKNRIWIKIK